MFASIGVDNNSLANKVHDRLIYSGGVSFLRRYLDLRAGVIFTGRISKRSTVWHVLASW